MLIEDSAEDAILITEAIARVIPREQIGICADGEAALDFFACQGAYAARNPAELPVFVLLDLGLPGASGLEVLRKIRAEPATQLLPVTVISSSELQENIRAAAELGANSFVLKSSVAQQLSDNLSQLARYWLELNIPPPAQTKL